MTDLDTPVQVAEPTLLGALEAEAPLDVTLDETHPALHTEGDVDRPALARAVRNQLAEVLRPLLDVPFTRPLLDAWCTWSSLREAGAATLGSDLPQTVDLSERTVKLVKRPQVEIAVDGVVLTTLTFEVTVDVEADVLGAVVRRGRLVALDGGACEAEVRLGLAGETLATGHLTLTPRLHLPLGDGIALTDVPVGPGVGSHVVGDDTPG